MRPDLRWEAREQLRGRIEGVRRAARADLLRGPEAAAVKASALGIALKCFQGAPGPPDNEGVAFCLRNLVELRQTDREGLGVCSQALEVLRGLPAGEYPEEEVEWLATTAWNRGVQLCIVLFFIFHFMLP